MANVDIVIKTINDGKGVQQAESQLMSLTKTVAKVGLALTAFGLAAKAAFNFAEQGAQLSRLETAGSNLARSYGADMNTILSALKKASRGTVAETDLILSANRAMMLGVSTDAEEMANLLEVAAFRGRAMGLSTTQAFNDIVTGVGRMSPLILDNLGIVLDLDKRTRDWAAANGVAADKVDAATKRQILLNGVLEEGNRQLEEAGGLADDAASAYERFGAQGADAFNRLKKAAGEFFEPFISGAADVIIQLNAIAENEDLLARRFGSFAVGMVEATSSWHRTFTNIGNDFEMLGEAAGSSAASIQQSFDAIDPDFGNKVAGWLEDLEFKMAGGMQLQGLSDAISQAWEAGKITDEQAQSMLQSVFAEAQNLQVDLGNIDASQAAQNISTTLGISLSDSKQLVTDMQTGLNLINTGEFTAMVNVVATGDTWVFGLTSGLTSGANVGGARANKPSSVGNVNRRDLEFRASGGWLGKITEVGEEGAEGIIEVAPGKFWVIPADEWRMRKRQGLRPDAGMARGGEWDGGGGLRVGEDVRALRLRGWTMTDIRNLEDPTSPDFAPIGGGGGGGGTSQTISNVAQSAAASAAAGVGSAVAAQSQQESSRAISAFTQTSVRSSSDLIKEVRVLVEEVRKLAKADDMRRVFREGSQFQASI